MRTPPIANALLLIAALVGCRDSSLSHATGQVSFAKSTLDFGTLYRGQSIQQSVQVRNDGRAELPVTWASPAEPFTVGGLPDTVPAGAISVQLHFAPSDAGTFNSTLAVSSGADAAVLELMGIALDPPACPTPVACHAVAFDLSQGACIDSALADGTACDPHDVCLLNANCRSGRCVGQQQTCDDHNPCTVDVCDALLGCQHFAVACPGNGACQVGACDPQTGCGFAPAPDGTVCGAVDCNMAEVCIAGACTSRVPPDGFVCAPASPCQGEGRCFTSVCQRPAASPLGQPWSLESNAPDGGGLSLNDFVLGDDGAMTLLGYFQPATLRANETQPGTTSPSRRCILWNNKLACADYSAQGTVGLLDATTGAPFWTFDLVTARPDFAALEAPGNLFMARLASLGSDHLAALFEGYPVGAVGGLCRNYFLIILDTGGAMIAAEQVTDPLLDVCNHPHPFGVVSDAAGRLFLAFSPTLSRSAPLQAASPTLLIAYDHDGTLMWKQTAGTTGGELATSRGLLYPERSGAAYTTLNGSAVPLPAGGAVALGEPVLTADRMTPSPVPGQGQLFGYHSDSLQVAWTYALPVGDSFTSDQIRLSDFRSHPTDPASSAVLAFARRAGQPSLMAVDAETGAELWSCPVGYTSSDVPVLFEVSPDGVGLMEGTTTCGHCDPPFAGSTKALFRTLTAPGISPSSSSPWPGAFGGAGHGHHETSSLGGF